jgi:YHS domain-containing protein
MRAGGEGVSLEPAAQAAEVESIDPVCNMTVNVAESRYHSSYNGTTFYFCCLGCKEQFEREPDAYSLQPAT